MNVRPQFLGTIFSVILAPAIFIIYLGSLSGVIVAIILEILGLALIAKGSYTKNRSTVKTARSTLSIGLIVVAVTSVILFGLFILIFALSSG